MRPIRMGNLIKPKLLKLSEKMGLVFKTIAKPLDVNSIKLQLGKLIKIKIVPGDVAVITSRVEKVAIKTTPAQDKDIVSDEKLVLEFWSDYVLSFSQLTFEADKQIAKEQILGRWKKPSAGMLQRFCHYDTSLHIHFNFIL